MHRGAATVDSRPPHPAYLIGLPVCVAVEMAVLLSTPTPIGRVIANGLAWTGRALNFLYQVEAEILSVLGGFTWSSSFLK